MTEHIDDVIMVVDNDESAWDYVHEIIDNYKDEGPTQVGERIKEYFLTDGGPAVAAMMLAEFMGSVSSRELGAHYIETFVSEDE